VRLCKYCNEKLQHHAAKVCDKCFPEHIKNYAREYRENNRKICQERSKKSQKKNSEKYRIKRREYYRKKHGIALDDPFVKRRAGEGNIDAQGYKTITKRGHPNQMDKHGRIREHVFIMSEHLKRPLKKGESVHHKNGDRLDNNIENLELWVVGQPPGQRVEDKIKWAMDFLENYGYTISK
jgi:HNH endonuclease